jgi:hypothetical protein
LVAAVSTLAFSQTATGQELPNSIRGYKVHHAGASVVSIDTTNGDDVRSDISITLKTPEVIEITLSGAVFEVDAEFTASRSGKVDLITFHDFQVNGIPFEIDDVATPFSFKKNKVATIPKPARVSVSLTSVPRAIYQQISDNPSDLTVTGTAFVFGKFKKFGMTFNRVVPITIDLTIKNPLHGR